MSTLPTPRTDAAAKNVSRFFPGQMVVPIEDCKKLERELTEAKAALTTSTERLTLELREAKAERDALKENWLDANAQWLKCADALQEKCDIEDRLSADLSRWRALAEELAGALEHLIGVAGYAMRQPESELDCAAELEEPRKALARFRDAANPASARTPPGTNGRSGDEC